MAEAIAGRPQVGKLLGTPGEREAQSLQRVRAPAYLLKNGVVRNGAQLARMADHGRSDHAVRNVGIGGHLLHLLAEAPELQRLYSFVSAGR